MTPDPTSPKTFDPVERLGPKEMAALIRDAWGALNFILAFYEPGQRYLDTEAWKVCEARARAVHKRLENAKSLLAEQGEG